MTEKIKTSYKAYSAWDYQKEIEELNKKSEQGWQLIKCGCFHSKFVYNPQIRYCYQLDFGKVEDLGRYIETFREQGWEYVNSTFNGWHCFRKLYDPDLPQTAYEIFTDRQSLEEMNRRWARLGLTISSIVGAMLLFDIVRLIARPQFPVLVQTVMLLLEVLFLLRGVFIMRNSNASRKRRGDGALLAAFLIVLILGMSTSAVLTEHRVSLSSRLRTEWEGEAVESKWLAFAVKYPDRYYLDLKFDADKEFMVELVDEKGETVFSQAGTHLDKKGIPLNLKSGNYDFILKYDSDHQVEIDIH